VNWVGCATSKIRGLSPAVITGNFEGRTIEKCARVEYERSQEENERRRSKSLTSRLGALNTHQHRYVTKNGGEKGSGRGG